MSESEERTRTKWLITSHHELAERLNVLEKRKRVQLVKVLSILLVRILFIAKEQVNSCKSRLKMPRDARDLMVTHTIYQG